MKKSNYIYLLFLTLILNNCKSFNFNTTGHFTVSVLNDTINLPKYDNIECIDTIYIELSNHSKYNYFFVFNIVDVWFVPPDGDRYGKSTPVEGINVNFRYKKNNMKLETCMAYGYNPDITAEQIEMERQLIELESGKEKIIKAILKFPSLVYFNEETQFVENLRFAENIEIIFEPDDVSTLEFIKENKIGLGINDKILKTRKAFLLPVRIKCE